MTTTIARRSVLAGAAAGFFAPDIVRAAGGTVTITSGALSPGFTNLFLDAIIQNGLDERNGLKIAPPTEYTSLYAFHNDFAAGTFDLALGSWDTFATRHAGGVPIRLLCGMTTAEMIGVVVPGGGARSLRDLDGKILVGTQGSGVYRMLRAVIQETQGYDIEKTVTVQNVDVPAAAVTMVLAERAEAALAWEPNISIGILKRPDLRVVFNAGEAYRAKFGLDLPFFGAAIRKEALARAPDLGQRVNRMLKSCIDDLANRPGAITPEVAARTKIAMDAIRAGIASGRVRFSFVDAAEPEGRRVFSAASDFLFKYRALTSAVSPDFFGAA